MLKLTKTLTIAIFLTTSLGMQSTFADDTTITENTVMTQPQSALIDWTKKVQIELTSRMEKKLANQLIAKNYNIELTRVSVMVKPVTVKTRIVLAKNAVVNF